MTTRSLPGRFSRIVKHAAILSGLTVVTVGVAWMQVVVLP